MRSWPEASSGAHGRRGGCARAQPMAAASAGAGAVEDADADDGLIRFHPEVHGTNVRMSADRRSAERTESFCGAVCVSEYPLGRDCYGVRSYTIVVTRQEGWAGGSRLGVMRCDPADFSLPSNLSSPHGDCWHLGDGAVCHSLGQSTGHNVDVINKVLRCRGTFTCILSHSRDVTCARRRTVQTGDGDYRFRD